MGLFGRDEPAPEIKTPQPTRKTGASPAVGSENRTVIARPTRIEGRVLGSGEVLVDGTIKGIIDSDGKVRVAEQGRVEADVHARLVAVAGTVTGNITADERIILEPTAHVDGNITAPRILIEDGAIFKGQVNMRAHRSLAGRHHASACGGRFTPITSHPRQYMFQNGSVNTLHATVDQIVGELLDERVDVCGGRCLIDLELRHQPPHQPLVIVNPVPKRLHQRHPGVVDRKNPQRIHVENHTRVIRQAGLADALRGQQTRKVNRSPHGAPLARTSHQVPATAGDALHPAVFARIGVLDVL